MQHPSVLRPAHSLLRLTERDLLAWSLLAAVGLLMVLAAPPLAGRIYVRDDLGAFHLPVRAFYAQQLARGEPFDWMPQLYCGFYLTGEGQAGTYHPLHWLWYRFLPLPAALGCEYLASYPLMLAGTWLFLRRRLSSTAAAMLGSLTFTFSAFGLLHFIHPNAVMVVAHIPWLLWAIDIVVLDSRRLRVTLAQAGIALLTGSQLLLGYPQYVWFSLVAEAAYTAFVLIDRRRWPPDSGDIAGVCHCLPPGKQCVHRSSDTASIEAVPHQLSKVPPAGLLGYPCNSWARIVIAKGTGVLLGSVQLLPTLDALGHSARWSADAAFAGWGSLHPLNLVQLVAPYLFAQRVYGQNTHELGLYVGAAPLVLAVWALARRRELGTLAPLAWAAAGFGLLALILAMGDYGPLYRLQTGLPLVGHFRFPCRYIVLFQLAMAVLAAIGFALLLRRDGNQSAATRRCAALWLLLAGSVATAITGVVLQGAASIAAVPAVLSGPLLIGAAVLLVVLAARGVQAALLGLVLLTAADLGYYGLSYSAYRQHAPLSEFVAAALTPPGGAEGRVTDRQVRFDEPGLRTGNEMTLSGWQRADGYAGLEPARRLDYRNLSALRVAGVRWVKREPATTAIEGLVPCNASWLEVPRPLPRVRLVTQAVASSDPARDIQRVDVDAVALTEEPLALPVSAPGAATLAAEQPGRLEMRADCPAPQLLVLAESFHSGWQASVDGQPQVVLRLNGDFMGCVVPQGRHEVRFVFRPRSLRIGRLDSLLGFGVLAMCVVGGLRRSLPQMTNSEGPQRKNEP